MVRSGALIVLGLLWLSACGEVEKVTNKVENAIAESVLSSFEDKNTFKGEVQRSPLKFKKFDSRLSSVTFGKKNGEERRKIDIKAGDTTLNLGLGSVNRVQGIRITIVNWRDELGEVPVLNPQEAPLDGSPYAVVAYTEVQRGNTSEKKHEDWFTYLTTGGTLTLKAVQPGEGGGIKGAITFTVLLMDVQQPVPNTIDSLPEVHFKGTFNIRPDKSSPLF